MMPHFFGASLWTIKGETMNTFLKTLCVFYLVLQCCHAGDLDDGISKYTDDPVSKYDEVFKKDINIAYIKSQSNAKKNMRHINKKNSMKSIDKNVTDKDGITRDSKGNMYISRKSKIRPGQTIVNRPEGGAELEGNMVIDKDVRVPIGARVINAPKFKQKR